MRIAVLTKMKVVCHKTACQTVFGNISVHDLRHDKRAFLNKIHFNKLRCGII